MPRRPLPPATLARLLRARDRLHDAPDDAPRVAELAADVGLSRAHFLRGFALAFGRTPHDYLTAVRLDRAKRVLARGASVTEACGTFGGGVLETEDIQRTYAELKARGVEFLREPKEMPYGIEALFRDDSGNFFSLCQRTS